MATSKSRAKKTAAKISKVTHKEGAAVLGVMTYWSASGRITVDELRALFQKHDLDEDRWFPPVIRGTVAFRKATREVRHDGYIKRPIVEDERRIVWGIIREDVTDEENAEMELAVEAKIAYDKETESVYVKGAGNALAFAQEMAQCYEAMTETYVAWDLQRMLKRAIVDIMGAVTLRKNGGFYFTPGHHLPDLEKLQAVMEEIDDCDVGLIVVSDDEHSKKSVGEETRRSFEEELGLIKQEIERFKNSPPREGTLERRLGKFKQLKAKADMYAQLLSVNMSDLKQGVDDCAQQVKALLKSLQAAPSIADEQPKLEVVAQREDSAAKANKKAAKTKPRKVRKVAQG